MLRLSDDLYALEKQLAETKVPLFFIQGGADVLVAPKSVAYLQSKIPDAEADTTARTRDKTKGTLISASVAHNAAKREYDTILKDNCKADKTA